jgi:4-hydroxybenzoate polyprenyltransferase
MAIEKLSLPVDETSASLMKQVRNTSISRVDNAQERIWSRKLISLLQGTAFPGSLTTFIRTLWLFSYSDISTFVVPDTAFGVLGALSGPRLTTNSSPDTIAILSRLPVAALYIWLNVLVFELANQRLPEAVIEDALNKPWRPLPNGLITPVQTRRFLMGVLPVILGISYFMGVWKETSLLFTLTWMYNDLKGGDENFIVRNIIIGAAFAVYNEGALRIACGPGQVPTKEAYIWTAVVSGVIFSTMHVQDMQDQDGDRAKGRHSAPLILGDYVARWTVAVPVVLWSFICPFMWDIGILGWVSPIAVGSVIAVRELWLREPVADHNTWVLWACWLSCLYLLPFLKEKVSFL